MYTSDNQLKYCFPSDTDLTTITITSVVLKKGKPVTKELSARRTQLMNIGSDSYRYYSVGKTKRDFQRWRFPLEPGCIIDDETGSYEVLSVDDLMSYPKIPFLHTRRISSTNII